MFVKAACLQLVFLSCCVLGGAAQIETGSFIGTVVDPNGAVVPGAKLTLLSETTGATRITTSDDRGNFEFNAVHAGSYVISVERDGFKKLEKKNLNLLTNAHLWLGQIQIAPR